MNDDEHLRVQALEGIVKSGHKLRIDVGNYEEELSKVHRTKTTKKKVVQKKTKSLQKKSSYRVKNKLRSVRWIQGKLVVRFDKKLSSKDVNYFTRYDKKRKKYLYIFEIHGRMTQKSQRLYKNGVDAIFLKQKNPTTLRLVIENRYKLKVRFSFKGNLLNITIAKAKQSAKKTYHKAVSKKVAKPSYFQGKTIVIDPGHGGKDPGAIGYRHYREKVVVLQIARTLRDILKKRGYRVYMTRSDDNFIKLRNRTKYANRKDADLFISIHANALGGKNARKVEGIECYFLDKSRSSRAKKVAAQENSADMSEMDYYGKEIFLSTLNSHNIVASNKLAIDLQRGALANLRKHYKGVKDSGVRPAPFWVLVGAQMPAVLVEVGFISHPKEAKRLVNRTYQRRMAEGLANGVDRYFINN